MLLESLLVCQDARVTAAIQQMCARVGIPPKACSGHEQATALLSKCKFYGVIVDGTDPQAAAQLLDAIRKSASSKRAVSIAILSGGAQSLGTVFELRTPMAEDLALRTFRAARAVMFNEFRRSGRHPLKALVAIITPAGQEFHAKAVNISQGGLAVRLTSSSGLAARSTVHCRLHLPPTSTLIELKGEIIWSDGTGLTGLQIQGVSARDKRELESWLSTRTVG